MTKEEIDNYLTTELRKYNLQPEGDILNNYKRWLKTINRPKNDPKKPPKFATILVNIKENITQEELKLEVYKIVNLHEEALK